MILHIALKELYHNITTPRFITGFVLCLLLIPFSIVISINEYKSKVSVYEIEKKKADRENLAKVYSEYRPVIVKEPSPMSIFAKGISYNVGSRIKVLFGDKPMMTEGKAESRDNPFLNRFFTFDFVSVLIIIISLMAFLFTYDICTGERESGTLKTMLSNPVSRAVILTGKMAGTLLTLLPVLLFSFGLCLLVILFAPGIKFTAPEWARTGMIFLYSLLFMIVFMIIGLFVSSRVRNSGASIVICLLLWVIFLFIVPNMANYSAKSFVKTGSVENLNFDINALETELNNAVDDYNKKLPEADWSMSWSYFGGIDGRKIISGSTRSFMERERKKNEYSEPMRIQYAEKKWQFRKQYLDRLEKQQKTAAFCSFLSPSEVFKESVAGLCATNYKSHGNFLEQVRAYRESLVDYFIKNKIFSSYKYFNQMDPDRYLTADEIVRKRSGGKCKDYTEFVTKFGGDWEILTEDIPGDNLWEWSPMDMSHLPAFVYQRASVTTDIKNSLLYFGILSGIAVILFYLSFLSFLKYDVR